MWNEMLERLKIPVGKWVLLLAECWAQAEDHMSCHFASNGDVGARAVGCEARPWAHGVT